MWTTSTAYPYVATWGNTVYKTVATLDAASGQEAHATQADPLVRQRRRRTTSGCPRAHPRSTPPTPAPAASRPRTRSGRPGSTTRRRSTPESDPAATTTEGRTSSSHRCRRLPPTLSVTAGDGQAQLTWTPGTATGAAPATQWSVYRGDPGAETLLVSLDGSRTDYLDTGLTDGASYTYYLVATNPAGQSPPSAGGHRRAGRAQPDAHHPLPDADHSLTDADHPVTDTATPTTTPLTLYLTDTSSATLSGARKLVAGRARRPRRRTRRSSATATGWGPVFAGGTTQTWPAGAAEPGVNTHGFLADATPLTGTTLSAGLVRHPRSR